MRLRFVQQRTNAFTQTAVDTFVSIDQRIIEAFFVWCHSDAGVTQRLAQAPQPQQSVLLVMVIIISPS